MMRTVTYRNGINTVETNTHGKTVLALVVPDFNLMADKQMIFKLGLCEL